MRIAEGQYLRGLGLRLKTVPGVRIPLPPPRSLDCREIAPHPTPKYAKLARILRFFLDKPDWRERTDRDRMASTCRLFSGGPKRSPVSRKTLGECNAITSSECGRGGLTCASILQPNSARTRPLGSKKAFINTNLENLPTRRVLARNNLLFARNPGEPQGLNDSVAQPAVPAALTLPVGLRDSTRKRWYQCPLARIADAAKVVCPETDVGELKGGRRNLRPPSMKPG